MSSSSLALPLSAPAAGAALVAAKPVAAPSSSLSSSSSTEETWLNIIQRFVSNNPGVVAASVVAILAVAVGGYFVFAPSAAPKTKKPVDPLVEKKSSKKVRKSEEAQKAVAQAEEQIKRTLSAETKLSSSTEPKKEEEEKPQKPLEEMTLAERSEAAKAAKTKGNKYYQGSNFEKAGELYTEAIRVSPPSETANLAVYYSNRAACYNNLAGKEDAIIADCTKALEYDPRYIKALNRRAQAYENTKQLQPALYDYTAVCILEGFQNEKAVKAADRVLKELGHAEAVERMKTRSPRLPSPHFIMSYLDTFKTKEYENPPAPSAETPEADALYIQALENVKDRKYDEALELFEQAINQKTSFAAKALNWRGTFLYLKGDLEAALADFNASLSLDPTNTNSLIKRGSIFIEKNDSEGALGDFKHAVEIDAENSEVFYHRAQVYFLMNKLPEAISDYQKSIELYDGIAFAHIQLAVSQYRYEQQDAALETFRRAEKRFPDSHDVFNYYGEVLLDQTRFDEALQKFEIALKLAPNSPLAYINKGLLLFQMKRDIDVAMTLVKKAIEIDDRCDVAYAHLAQLNLQQNKIPEAIANYEKAADLTRTVVEMANVISCREAAAAQLHVIQTLGLVPPTMP